jgi:hypothetical protein
MIISLWGAFVLFPYIQILFRYTYIFFNIKMFITIELSKLTEPKVAYHYLPYANGVFDILST